MGKPKKTWYEREEISRVTMDFVKMNCNITDREKELLRIINKRKLVRRDMLEIISPSYRYLGENRTRIINRSINKMFKNMCLDKIHEPQKLTGGNTPAIVAVDRAGSLILGIPHKNRIKKYSKIINGKKITSRELPLNYRHINGVNQLEVETILFCENTGNELLDWVLESSIKIHYAQELIHLIPDVIMSLKPLKSPLKTFYAFIEFDTGSESIGYKNPPVIRNKIIKYKKYKLSRLWENQYSHFPMVILVTEDEKRIDFFNKECERNDVLGLGVYYKSYKRFLEYLENII